MLQHSITDFIPSTTICPDPPIFITRSVRLITWESTSLFRSRSQSRLPSSSSFCATRNLISALWRRSDQGCSASQDIKQGFTPDALPTLAHRCSSSQEYPGSDQLLTLASSRTLRESKPTSSRFLLKSLSDPCTSGQPPPDSIKCLLFYATQFRIVLA